MKQKIRTFVAVDINRAVRDAVAERIELLAATGASVRWVEPNNLHLTLKFLDEIDSRTIHEVCRAVGLAAESMPTFDLVMHGAGAFPNATRPKTLWFGVADGSDSIIALAERVDEQLNQIGFAREGRRFKPHLTIGRARGGGPAMNELVEMLAFFEDEPLGRSPVTEVVIYSSELSRSGPIYTPLGRARLAKK